MGVRGLEPPLGVCRPNLEAVAAARAVDALVFWTLRIGIRDGVVASSGNKKSISFRTVMAWYTTLRSNLHRQASVGQIISYNTFTGKCHLLRKIPGIFFFIEHTCAV